jgi:GAF domain-containing protein
MVMGVLLYDLLLYALEAYGAFTPPFSVDLRAFRFLGLSFGLLMLFSTSGIAMRLGRQNFRHILDRLHERILRMERAHHTLEGNVEEDTAELHWKIQQLRTIAELTRGMTSLSDLDTLLNQSVRLIAERFGFYHVGIFLFDETGDWAVLRAAADLAASPPGQASSHSTDQEPVSDAGSAMTSSVSDRDDGSRFMQERVRIVEQGVIGYVARTGRPRVAFESGGDMMMLDEIYATPIAPATSHERQQFPRLSEMCFEVALPLDTKGQIIGVLDVWMDCRNLRDRCRWLHQRREDVPAAEAFTEENVEILQILADNLAVAIQSAMLFDETRQTVERLGRYQESETLRAWRRALARRNMELSYVYVGGDVRTAEGESFVPFEEVTAVPEKIIVREKHDNDEDLSDGQASATSAKARYELIVPVQMQQRTIGALAFENRRPWRQDEIQLAESVVQQLGLALENARLLEETQTRALQERARSEIVSQLRALNSVDAILRSAAQQLGRALKVERSRIQLTPEDSMDTTAANVVSRSDVSSQGDFTSSGGSGE